MDIETILEMYEDDYVPSSKVPGQRNMKLAQVSRSDMDNFNTPDLEQSPDSFLKPGETLEDFDVTFRRPNALGGRIGFQDGLGPRNKIQQLGVGDEILQMYEDGDGTVKIAKKYNISKDTVNRFIKQSNPKLLRQSPPKVNQFNFDYNIIDQIKEDAKTMSRKEILKKYEGKISKKRLDKEKIVFGKVEESGRPKIPEGERSPKQVKRVNRIRNSQGFDVSGTFAKNFHHVFPIGGLSELSAQDVMILDKKFNETLGGFNLQLNDIADKIGSMDLSNPNALKELNDLNAESKNLVDRAKAKLPKELKNAIGYIEYNPVFDENGTIFELSQVRKGVDAPMGALPKEFGTKKFKDYTPEEIKKFKTRVKQLALQAGDKGTMFGANPFFDPSLMGKVISDLGKGVQVGLGPTGILALNTALGVDPTKSMDRASLGLEAALAKPLVKGATNVTDQVKNPMLRKIAERAALAGMSPAMAMKVARVANPIGIASLGLEGLYQVGKLGYEDQKRFDALSPEEQAAERAEQEAFAFDVTGA